ncbi:MAG: DUF2851 family protein [Bacteroidetes bacterium]|nr:MAG: DUF2851 family protein [Bacteroidota bacterium]
MPRKSPSHNVPERFLKQLWKHQNFATDILRTTDDRKIEILQPGTPNFDGGPDFQNAKVRIGGVVYRGDVELHQNFDDWVKHSHHRDPNYNRVILHVVFRAERLNAATTTASQREIPALVLEHYLTSSFRELWETMILDERSERLTNIKCFDLNEDVPSEMLQRWLNKLAIERIELKMRRFEERLKELIDEQRLFLKEPPRYGEIPFGINPEDLPVPVQLYTTRDFSNAHLWEQLIYEGYMEALGYSKNQEPFVKVARSVPLHRMMERVGNTDEQELAIEAMLFGISGLLSSSGRKDDDQSKKHVALLQERWKAFRTQYRGEVCHESEWQFFRLRPENFPTVRIAGAAILIKRQLQQRLLKSLIRILKNDGLRIKEKYQELINLFEVNAEGYWSSHYRFGEQAKKPLTKLVGNARADEILQNVVVPICFLYARTFKDKDVRNATLDVFDHCLPSSDNSILRTMNEQLIKDKLKLKNAKLQQGALQLYKFYCAEEKCGECAVGKVVFIKEG